jgi:hypothetical protein
LDDKQIGLTSWNRWCLFRCYIDHILPLNGPTPTHNGLPLSPPISYHRSEYWRIIWRLWYHYSSIHHWPPYLAIDNDGILMTPPGASRKDLANSITSYLTAPAETISQAILTLIIPHQGSGGTTTALKRTTITQSDTIIDYVIHCIRYSPSCIDQALMPVTYPYGYSNCPNNNMITSSVNVVTSSSSSSNTHLSIDVGEENSNNSNSGSECQLFRLVGSSKSEYDTVITTLQRLFYGASDSEEKMHEINKRLWKWSIKPTKPPNYFTALHLEAMLSSSSLMSLIGGSSLLQLPNELPICTKVMRQRKPSTYFRGFHNISRQYPDSYARWLALHIIPPVEPQTRWLKPYWYKPLLEYQSSFATMEQLLPHLLTITPLPSELCRLVCLTYPLLEHFLTYITIWRRLRKLK